MVFLSSKTMEHFILDFKRKQDVKYLSRPSGVSQHCKSFEKDGDD